MTLPQPYGSLSRYFLNQSIHFLAEANAVYLNNAKCGCTSIRRGMMAGVGKETKRSKISRKIKGKERDGWSPNFARINDDTTFITAVRNPYARLYSAYIEKIMMNKAPARAFFASLGMPLDSTPSFSDFVDLVGAATNVKDQHWRPQSENIYVGHVPMSVFHLETLSADVALFGAEIGIDMQMERKTAHATNSVARLDEVMTQEIADKIYAIYHMDFELFGYDRDWSNTKSKLQSPIRLPAAGDSDIIATLHAMDPNETPAGPANKIPFSAHVVLLEAGEDHTVTKNFQAQTDAAIAANDPETRFLGHAAAATIAEQGGDKNTLAMHLRAMIDLAPYFHGLRNRMVRAKIGQRDLDGAQTELDLAAVIEPGSAFIERLGTLISNRKAKDGAAA